MSATFLFLSLLFVSISDIGGVCQDRLINCNEYPRHAVCSTFPRWAKINCAEWCNQCVNDIHPYTVDHCPVGWNRSESDSTCFKVFGSDDKGSRLTWRKAQEECGRMMSRLVLIKDEDKNSIVAESLDSGLDYWVGLKNVGEKTVMRFQYVDNTIMSNTSYSNWSLNQPNNYKNKQHCVAIHGSGDWNDAGCLSKKPFICQKELVDPCSPGWEYAESDGTCFKSFGINDDAFQMDWYNAKKECKKNGASLVIITDMKTNSAITATLNVNFSYWMGLRNLGDEIKIFQYVNNARMSFSNWNATEPDNLHNKQHCVLLLATGKWSDHGCLHKYPFICQKNKNE